MRHIEAYLKGKSHVIWDWNGTLVDDVDLCVAMLAEQLKEHRLDPVSKSTHREMFCFPIYDYYRKLGFVFDEESYKVSAARFIRDHNEALLRCRLFDGVADFIRSLKNRDIKQSVLSATHEPLLYQQLRHFEIFELFDWVYGLSDHYGKSKIERGRQLIFESGIAPEETLLIGDTDHDLAVGQTLGIDVVLVAEGHQSFERLKKLHDHVVPSLN